MCGCIELYSGNGVVLGNDMLRWSWLLFAGVGLLGVGCQSPDDKDKTMLTLFEKAPRPNAQGSQPFRVELPATGGKLTVFVSGIIADREQMSLLLRDARVASDAEGDYVMELFLSDRGRVDLARLSGNTHLLLVATWYDVNAKPKAGSVRRLLGSFTVDENMQHGLMRFIPLTKSKAEAEKRVRGIKRMLGHKVK